MIAPLEPEIYITAGDSILIAWNANTTEVPIPVPDCKVAERDVHVLPPSRVIIIVDFLPAANATRGP